MGMCCTFACIASGSKNQIELENSCGFIEPPPEKKYKKKCIQLWMKDAVY
jgi:hypothetical protein